ncbi:heme/hemin ABC transporter substrate-binding protein [Oceanisphaera avium]|uniref:Fe/B12 periplasmic-binding domain-containing protein n=1 Tax=Oceanisphaera avium TaxID=1903694 RepID=A0A1Y0CX40_9GAMM|nr:ABC transporter substrate-binding protein [Oceanisphaera avium]ART79456.1 hypothetical protein CBP12_04235 [Oceanisphaera avium]
MTVRSLVALLWLFAAQSYAEPSRLLSVGSSVTELVFALDAEQQLVAVDSTSDLPPELELKRLGYHRQLSAEGILSTQPSLLIGSAEMGPARALSLVKQAGVKVEQLPEAMDAEQLGANIARLGELLKRPAQAKQLQLSVHQRAASLAEQQTRIKHKKATVFLLLGEGNSVQIAGRDTLANSLIETAGG